MASYRDVNQPNRLSKKSASTYLSYFVYPRARNLAEGFESYDFGITASVALE
jgi:hypothetical protein